MLVFSTSSKKPRVCSSASPCWDVWKFQAKTSQSIISLRLGLYWSMLCHYGIQHWQQNYQIAVRICRSEYINLPFDPWPIRKLWKWGETHAGCSLKIHKALMIIYIEFSSPRNTRSVNTMPFSLFKPHTNHYKDCPAIFTKRTFCKPHLQNKRQ